ncbi:MAG: hypothetical protein CSA10_00165 [Cardiobacteriales bacterium]|nr:MAG: hypothetical protein CSA10_00165 [Cardiobacteriales bacterium]
MKNYIVQKEIHTVSPNSKPKLLKIAIGLPYEIDDISWGCSWCIEGLYKSNKDAVGADAWQALTLAVKIIEQLLAYYIEDGGKLLWEPNGKEMNLNDVIPRHNGTQQYNRDCSR